MTALTASVPAPGEDEKKAELTIRAVWEYFADIVKLRLTPYEQHLLLKKFSKRDDAIFEAATKAEQLSIKCIAEATATIDALNDAIRRQQLVIDYTRTALNNAKVGVSFTDTDVGKLIEGMHAEIECLRLQLAASRHK
jgi:hypothetical protein